jgi:nucleoid DNA-binding protein
MPSKSKGDLNLMEDKEFFAMISQRCNYISEDLVKEFYYAMVKLISQELQHNGSVRLPALGDFILHYHKERNLRSVANGQIIRIPAKKNIKFSPNQGLRRFFHDLS